MKRLTLITLCVLIVSGTSLADLVPTGSAMWVQLPDLDPTGIDVYATNPKVLADDFLYAQTGPITSIHIWGSWLGDYLPNEPTGGNPSPSNVVFTLSIHADIPASALGGPGYSTPGVLLWARTFIPGQFAVSLFSEGPEGWYNPNTGEYLPEGDHQAWLYSFLIDPKDAFVQEVTADIPAVLWLDVSAIPLDDQAFFGWKTSTQHWNDDAVWADSHEGPWNELLYPDGHPAQGQSIDLAFVVVPEPATILLLGLGALTLLRRRRS
jgi:hypothetical protein